MSNFIFSSNLFVDCNAPNIISSSSRLLNISCGFSIIDCLFPVAIGQRELIIGDSQTGNSTLVLCIMINQLSLNLEFSFKSNLICILTCIAQNCSNIMRFYELLISSLSINFTIIVFVSIVEAMSLQYCSPLSSTCISEYFRNSTLSSLIIYDDLSNHAISYSQLSLTLSNPVGSEAFPSDIFYLHARLLESSCCLNLLFSSGSLACLPIIETLSNDLSAYVATNIISITDGQLYLDAVLFGLGIYPAINIEKSVSSVGANSLDVFWSSISFSIYSLLNEYNQELESIVKSVLFNLSNHSYDRLFNLIQQSSCSYHLFSVLGLLMIIHGFIDFISVKFISVFEFSLSSYDLCILTLILDSSFSLLKYFIIYHGFSVFGFNVLNWVNSLFSMIYIVSMVFQLFISVSIIGIQSLNLNFMSSIIESIQYMTTILWNEFIWKLIDSLWVLYNMSFNNSYFTKFSVWFSVWCLTTTFSLEFNCLIWI